MSRSRNLKPGFFKNEELAELPFEFRILFQGLWCLADRAGRLEDRPKRIKAEIFPYDDVDVNAGLAALSDQGFINRYSVSDNKYIQILAFEKHQNPHCKEPPSTIPAPCLHSASTEISGTSRADSLNPITDSLNHIQASPVGDAPASRPSGYQPILDAYHETLPNCQSVSALTDKRKRSLARAVKLAKSVCASNGWDYEPDTFWRGYFAVCSEDPWLRGDIPNPRNARWRQNLDVLLQDDRLGSVIDKAIDAMRSEA